MTCRGFDVFEWPDLDEEPQLSSPGVDPDMIKFFCGQAGQDGGRRACATSTAPPCFEKREEAVRWKTSEEEFFDR